MQELHTRNKLTLVYPSGGELFLVGSTESVKINSINNLKNVTVQISRDGGATFQLLGAIQTNSSR